MPFSRPPHRAFASFQRDPLGFLTAVRGQGDLASFRFGRQPVVLVSDLEAVQEVLTNSRLFAHETTVRRRWLRQSPIPVAPGLAAGDAEVHLRRRRALQPAFAREHLEPYVRIAIEATDEQTSQWEDGQQLDLATEMSQLALAIVARTVFGDHSHRLDRRRLATLVGEMVSGFNPAVSLLNVVGSSTRQVVRAFNALDGELGAYTEAHYAAHPDSSDVPSAIRRLESPPPGRAPQDVMTVLTAGQVTASAALSWTWVTLAQHPEHESGFRDELARVLKGREPAAGDLDALALTRQICAETLRLYPPNWYLGRRATQDVELLGQDLAKSTFVFVSPYLIHRDPRFYEDPDLFRPERFSAAAQAERHRLAFIPFGFGARRCIAERLAWLVQVLCVTRIAQGWAVHLHDLEPPLLAGAGLEPGGGVPASVERLGSKA